MKLNFRSWNCRTEWARYPNGALALQLVADGDQPAHEMFDGEPIARASVNLVDFGPAPGGQIIIKDYSENEGIAAALLKAGVLSGPATATIPCGHAHAHVYMLSDAARAEVAAYDAGGIAGVGVSPAPLVSTAMASDTIIDSEGGHCD